MVSILPQKVSPWQIIGQAMSQLGQNAPELLEKRYQRGQLQQSLDEIKNMAGQEGTKPLDLIISAMKAGAGIPGSERYLGALIPELAKFAQAGASQNIPLPGETTQRNREPLEPVAQRGISPTFLNQPEQRAQFFPTNVGLQGGPGNLPQPATTGEIRPIPTRVEMIDQAKDLAKKSTAAGIPLTTPQALEQIKGQVEEDKVHNELVEKERKQRVAGQQTYGQRAVEELKKTFPEATPELETVFQKYGEEQASKGKSEADINRALATKAKDFSNQITTIRKDMSAPRLQNAFIRKIKGEYKDFEQASKDLRVKLKPLLNEGLYDTARNLMSELGYYPEEIDVTVNPLGEREKTVLNKVPKVKTREAYLSGIHGFSPESKEIVKQGIRDLKEANPNFSPVLARKIFEDKGYDWRIFKDALNELEQEGMKLEGDQEKQRLNLDRPPLNILEHVLHGIRVIGR